MAPAPQVGAAGTGYERATGPAAGSSGASPARGLGAGDVAVQIGPPPPAADPYAQFRTDNGTPVAAAAAPIKSTAI